MKYLDVAYILRLYVEDAGWERVRELAAETSVVCGIHGYAETVAALHRKFREGTFSLSEYGQVQAQFETDCDNDAYRWLPIGPAVMERVQETYRRLPASVFLRASDALHLACASVNGLKEIYSNDQRLLDGAPHFDLRGVDVLSEPEPLPKAGKARPREVR